MSAEVLVRKWGWYCADCGTGDGEYTEEEAAEADAEQHDLENHELA